MANGTITRADLTRSPVEEVGLSRSDSAEALEEVLDEIAGCLVRGKAVKIHGFGAFSARHKKKRKERNPKTGEEVPILPRRVIKFHPSESLKLRINQHDGR
jgi:integration host factor subunit alpha